MPREDVPREAADRNRTAGEGNITRRRLLALSGTATVVGVAGCIGGGGGGGGTDTGTGGTDAGTGGTDTEAGGTDTGTDGTDTGGTQSGSLIDSTFTAHFGRARPSEVHFNIFNPTGTLTAGRNSPQQVMFDQLMNYNNETQEWSNRLLSNFSVEGTTVTLEFDSAYSWANGDPVRARDFVTQLQLGRYFGYPIWDFISEANATGERTAELTLPEETNPAIVRQQTNRWLYVKHSEYEQWLQEFETATGTEAENSVVSELQQWEYAPAGSGERPASHGPYMVEDIGDTEITLVRNENYPLETNIPRYTYRYLSGSKDFQATIADDLDGAAISAANEELVNQYPDHFNKVEIPVFGTTALHIQHDHELLGNRHVRKAMAYLADTGRVAQNSNPRVRSMEATTFMGDSQAQEWLGDQYEAYTQYGPGAKPDQAAAQMEEAGFTKEGGTWTDADGNSYSLEIQTPSWTAPLGVAQTMADQLSNFGIDATVQQLESTAWIGNYESGDFQLRGGYFGGGPHPYSAYAGFTGSVYQAANIPMEVELPPIGEPTGEPSSFDVAENITSLVTTTDEEEARQSIANLAWYVNQFLPSIPLTNGVIPSYYSTDAWTFPSPDEDPRMYLFHPIDQMLKVPQEEGSDQAVLQGKTE